MKSWVFNWIGKQKWSGMVVTNGTKPKVVGLNTPHVPLVFCLREKAQTLEALVLCLREKAQTLEAKVTWNQESMLWPVF
jgi:hypothetical protein